MARTNTLPSSWSVAGVTGPDSSRSPEQLSRNVSGVRYDMARFPQMLTPSPLVGGYTSETSINVLARFNAAGGYVSCNCAAHKPCNDYFATLGKDTALSALLEWRIVFYFWKPISRAGAAPQVGESIAVVEGEVISANHDTRFAQLVMSEFSLVSDMKLAATIVHELAHVAGAPGGTDDQRAKAATDKASKEYKRLIAAEMALRQCLLPSQFKPGALGVLQDMSQGWRAKGRAIS